MEGSCTMSKNCSIVCLVLVVWLLRCVHISKAQCEAPCEGTGPYSLGREPLPKDCKDIQDSGATKSGVYTIFPQDVYLCVSFRVYCDMETDGGGWTVFQRRYDNRLDFYLRWLDYRLGFGSLGSEFWLGNEHLHHLTTQDNYLLRVELEDFDGEKSWATYAGFRLGSETDNYRLYIGNYTGGDAGDSLSIHHGSSFSTSDSDLSGGSCSSFRGGAWWYPRRCGDSNLNGRYLAGTHTEYGEGVMWRSWRGLSYSLRGTEMKFRPMVEADRERAQGSPKEVGGQDADQENEEDGEEEETAEEEGETDEEGEEEGEGEGEGEDVSSYSSSSVEEPDEATEEPPIQPPRGTVKGSIQPRKRGKDKKNKKN